MAITNDVVRAENVEVDITDTMLADGMEQEMDLKEDWQARACPPPSGKYRLKLFLEKTDFEQGQKQNYKADDANGKYYKATVTCKIQDSTGKWQDSVVSYNASTGISKGKKISTMAGLLIMMGDTKLPAKISELKLAQRFLQVINKFAPILIAECDWSCWDRTPAKGQPLGKALKIGMKNFPAKKGGQPGEKEHILQNSTGEDCVARLKIMKWVGKPAPAGTVPTTPVQKPVPVVQPKVVPIQLDAPEAVSLDTENVSFDDSGEVILDE